MQWATAIAILFHLIGLMGILFFNSRLFILLTPLNLLLMFFLILYTQKNINRFFLIFLGVCFVGGIAIEIVGTKTAIFFGHYAYGKVLGPSIIGVPLVIGLNWFIVIYCCGTAMQLFLHTLLHKLSAITEKPSSALKRISILIDGATLALLFDWIMEPVAIRLGYWQWAGNGDIPIFNYLCWFVFSVVLLFIFDLCDFDKRNKFAVHLLLIQAMFFLLLRTFL